MSALDELLTPLRAAALTQEAGLLQAAWQATEGDWARVGAAALTAGSATLPGQPMARMTAASAALEALSAATGRRLRVDGPALLSERARLVGMAAPPAPGSSLRGAARMLRHPDGWSVFNLPRPSDREALPALGEGLAGTVAPGAEGALDAGLLAELDAWAAATPVEAAIERALLLDLAAARVPGTDELRPAPPFRLSQLQPHALTDRHRLAVADLSTLWAGPLLGALLSEGGADVVKIESTARPERPLPGDRAFSERLNGAKRALQLDFAEPAALREQLDGADVVIVSARRRALERLGITPRPGQILVRITAHGHDGPAAARVGFGDDCAAAAGAVGRVDGRPVFAADALADPVTGLLGAVAVHGLLRAGLAGVVDLDLVSSARWLVADAAAGAGGG